MRKVIIVSELNIYLSVYVILHGTGVGKSRITFVCVENNTIIHQ